MHLKKGISFIGVFSIGFGSMISSGIFILPGLAFVKVGSAVFLSYLIAGIMGFLGILSVIELSTAMPQAGGDYYFINKAFGPLFGTISGILGWLALSLKSAFAIFGIAEILYLYTDISPLISGLFLCLFFVLINIKGVHEASLFQVLMVIALFFLLLVFIVAGFPLVESENFTEFSSVEINDIFITAGFIFISFGGLLKVANVSEEVIYPKRNIPLGVLSSIIVVTVFYTLIVFVITGTLDPAFFKETLTPVADSAKITMGSVGYFLITIASLLAFFTTANAGIMSASRYPMALSRDQLIPPLFGKINNKYKTPGFAIIFTGIIVYLTQLLPLDILVKSASTVILTSYVLTNISVIILRESRITNYRPSFKAPFYPFLQVACVILFTFLIIDLGLDAIEISLSFIFISFCVYMLYGKKIKQRESALLHLLKRITDSRLSENILEDELREVLVNRDNIEQDSFDNLIKRAEILDIQEPLSFEMLLKRVAKGISEKTEMREEEIISRFLKRQEECNSAISDFLAIPHIIIDGKDKIFLTIIRCKDGVQFTENEKKVHAVFLFGGTQDRRILHLKTIASIATLVQNRDFHNKWLAAENIVELKNLMILSNRKRFF